MLLLLLRICQRYKIESNSQLDERYYLSDRNCCEYVKDTKLKAIHNPNASRTNLFQLLRICQRYKIESNSQQ